MYLISHVRVRTKVKTGEVTDAIILSFPLGHILLYSSDTLVFSGIKCKISDIKRFDP